MKTALLLSEIFPPKTGGSGRWLWEVYRRLPRGQFVIAAGEDARALEFDRSHDAKVCRVPLGFSTWGIANLRGMSAYWRGLQAVRHIMQSQHPVRVGHLHCARCLPEGWIGWLVKRLYGIPYICYVHGEEANYAKSSRELGWMMRRVLAGAQFTIANSQNTRSLLRQDWQLPEKKIRLLHPGVDTKRFIPAKRDAETRRRLGWGERPVVLTVGRLDERKGHDRTIEAMVRIRKLVPDILYSIVGDGIQRQRLELLVQQYDVGGSVEFRGEPVDDELIECYQQCDLFVLANRQVGQDIEGFGMVLVEAQSCGKPVIAGDSGGTAETMRVGESGLILDCTTADQLVEVIPKLLLDETLRVRMGAAGRQFVVENLDWEPLAAQALAIFQQGTSPSAG